MTELDSECLLNLQHAEPTPAFLRAQQLARLPDVEVHGTLGHSQPVQEVSSIWAARLWNMRRIHKRFIGLPALVRILNALPEKERIEQIALTSGRTTAVVFYRAFSHQPLGAVISVQTPADVERSMNNWSQAIGMSVTEKKLSRNSRHELRKLAGIAALQR